MFRWRRDANEFATSRRAPDVRAHDVEERRDQPAGQGNHIELIPTVTVESRHSVDGPTGRDFSSIYIVRELWGPEVESRSSFFPEKLPFWKKTTPYGEIKKIVPKGFIATQIHALCANFVKLGRPEVGEIARCLPDKKFRLALSLSLLCRSRPKCAKSSDKQCTQRAPNFIQIGSLSAEL